MTVQAMGNLLVTYKIFCVALKTDCLLSRFIGQLKLVRICQVLLNEQKAKTMVLDFDKIESLVGTMSHPLLNGTNLTYDRLSIPLDTRNKSRIPPHH